MIFQLKKIPLIMGTALIISGLNLPLFAKESDLNITIYNDSIALIQEARAITLKEGIQSLELDNVSAQIISQSNQIERLEGAPFTLLEQNFDYDLLSPEAMLKKAVGQKVLIIRPATENGKEIREEATILANNSGLILQYEDRIETNLPPAARIAFLELPDELLTSPTLSLLLKSKEAGERKIGLKYLSRGFSWQADYVGNLHENEEKIDITSWVTLNNNSGTHFENAKLQLVAGEVNLEPTLMRSKRGQLHQEMMPLVIASDSPSALHESFSDYHLYTIAHPTSLKNNQEKQVLLFEAKEIPVKKVYRFPTAYSAYNNVNFNPKPIRAELYYLIDNREESKLGFPFPAGNFRLYSDNQAGESLFVGADQIDHTAKNEMIRLATGSAFDLSYTRKVNRIERLSKTRIETQYEALFKNGSDQTITATYTHQINNPTEWVTAIKEESLPSTRTDANRIEWEIEIPANGETTLLYTLDEEERKRES